MRNTCSVLWLASLLFCSSVQAQKIKPRLKEIPLNSLEAFQTPASNWQLVGDAIAGYNDTALNTAKGTGILFNNYNSSLQWKPGQNLFTKMEHGDLLLEFDVMLPKGSNSGIYLQGRYEVQLFDSWGVKVPKFGDMGGLYQRMENNKGVDGKGPLKNAALAPGLWQHMEISFQAPRFDAAGNKITSAKFNYVRLNGITLHENINVAGPTISAAYNDEKAYGPLMIQGDHGAVAFKNIRFAPQDELKVPLSGINYKYYEKSATSLEEAAKTKPTSQGNNVAIDSRLASARDKFFLLFEGKMNIASSDSYTFSSLYSGTASLEIDGKTVIEPQEIWIGGNPVYGTADLDAGEHAFRLWLNKDMGWARPGLSLYIEKANSRAVALHTPASIPERAPDPLIAVRADKEPEMVRSFMNHNGKKLTHVVSVGDPAQVHYAYDLLQGALLQVWKGEFLNTTDMWHERGEPQTAKPLGAPIVLSGKSLLYNKTLKKDSITGLEYKGYVLKTTGLPVFRYAYASLQLEDHVQALENGRGLKRTISVTGNGREKQLIRIGHATEITPMGGGLYSMDNGSYFLQLAPGTFPRMETFLDQKVLLLPATEEIQYQLIW
jgi:hypothetical protein